MITRHGILGAVERAVNHVATTAVYCFALSDTGLQDDAFAAAVARHPELFSPDTVQLLKKAGREVECNFVSTVGLSLTSA